MCLRTRGWSGCSPMFFQLQHSLCVPKVHLLLKNLFWELGASLPRPCPRLQVSGKEGEQCGRGQGVLGRVVPCWSAQQQPWNSFKGKTVTLHQGRNQHCGQRPSTASRETNTRVVRVEEDERDFCSVEKKKNSALWRQ